MRVFHTNLVNSIIYFKAFTSNFVEKYLLYLFKIPLFYFIYPIYNTPHIPFSTLLLFYLYIIILFFILIFFFKQNSRYTLAKKIHQKTLTAIKPTQIQPTKNPITTIIIRKFSIPKTQSQQQQFTNLAYQKPKRSNNIQIQLTTTYPKPIGFRHPNIAKINQQKHISTSHRPNPFCRRRNPKPKTQTHFTVGDGATQIPNLKLQTTASTRPQPKQRCRRSTQRPDWPPQTTSTLATHGERCESVSEIGESCESESFLARQEMGYKSIDGGGSTDF